MKLSSETPPSGRPSQRRPLALRLALSATAIGCALWYGVSRISHPGPAAEQSVTHSIPADLPRPSGNQDKDFSLWINDPSASNTSDLAAYFLKKGRLRRTQELEQIAAAYEKDPDRYAEAMRQFANAAFDVDPAGTMDFLSRLHTSAGIIPLERELMNRWMKKGVASITESLLAASRGNQSTPLIQLGFLSSVCQNEHSGELPHLVSWIAGLTDPKDSGLKIQAVQALVETSKPESFGEISTLLASQLDQPAMAAWAARLGARQIGHDPQGVLDWIAAAPPGEGKRAMAGDVIRALAVGHPEMAASLVSEPGRLNAIFATPEDPRQDHLQDRALAEYLEATMSEAPDAALQASGMFHDEQLAVAYGEKARRLMESSPARR